MVKNGYELIVLDRPKRFKENRIVNHLQWQNGAANFTNGNITKGTY